MAGKSGPQVTYRVGPDKGAELNVVRCSVCQSWLDMNVQRIGGGAGDDSEAFTDTDGETAYRPAISNTSVCWFCGTDNWKVGSHGIGKP